MRQTKPPRRRWFYTTQVNRACIYKIQGPALAGLFFWFGFGFNSGSGSGLIRVRAFNNNSKITII
jgi:hypothetical protein